MGCLKERDDEQVTVIKMVNRDQNIFLLPEIRLLYITLTDSHKQNVLGHLFQTNKQAARVECHIVSMLREQNGRALCPRGGGKSRGNFL